MAFIRWFEEISLADTAAVGRKVASLGALIRELSPRGLRLPAGFAVSAEGCRRFLRGAGLEQPAADALAGFAGKDPAGRAACAGRVQALIEAAPLPADLEAELCGAYRTLSRRSGGEDTDVAVRSSPTDERHPGVASSQETFLNVRGEAGLASAVRRCFGGLFSARALGDRADRGQDLLSSEMAVAVQKMVRSDLASSGVLFTCDPESGHDGVILLTSSFGLGEAVVQGQVEPDQFLVHKKTLRDGHKSLVRKAIARKRSRLVYAAGGGDQVELEDVPADEQRRPSLSDAEALQLCSWALLVEDHYRKARGQKAPLHIEWGKDGLTGALHLLQVREEPARAERRRVHRLDSQGLQPLVSGLAVGQGVATGKARVLASPKDLAQLQPGEILVTGEPHPDWEPALKLAAGLVTERGGRTAHAATVARELSVPAILGTGDAMSRLADGQQLTLSCAEGETGKVYAGAVPFEVEELDPRSAARPRTKVLLNLSNPELALSLSQLPSDGVGLLRLELLFACSVRVHPLALTRFAELPHELMVEVDRATRGYPDKAEYFVDKLAQGIGVIAAAFFPRPVVLRLSDFSSSELAGLACGKHFEPRDGKALLGSQPDYQEAFRLEVAALRRVREEFGLTNLKILVPACGTAAEARRVLDVLADGGLVQGRHGLEIHALAHLPSSGELSDELAQLFDGLSIDARELRQPEACAPIVQAARRQGKQVTLCGQAPADLADLIVEQGLDAVSLEPAALLQTAARVLSAEQLSLRRRATDRTARQALSQERRRGSDRRGEREPAPGAAKVAPLAGAPAADHLTMRGAFALAEAAAAAASAPAAAGEPADTLALLIEGAPRAGE